MSGQFLKAVTSAWFV